MTVANLVTRRTALFTGAALAALCSASCKEEGVSRAAASSGSAEAQDARAGRMELELPPPVTAAPTVAPPGAVPGAETAQVGVGDSASTPDYKLTLLAVKECKVETYFKPKAGNIKLGVQ